MLCQLRATDLYKYKRHSQNTKNKKTMFAPWLLGELQLMKESVQKGMFSIFYLHILSLFYTQETIVVSHFYVSGEIRFKLVSSFRLADRCEISNQITTKLVVPVIRVPWRKLNFS